MSDDLVETIARAMCVVRGRNPDDCTAGSGGVSQGGAAYSTCHQRAWEQQAPMAQAALDAIKAAGWRPPPTGYQAKWTVGYPLRYGGVYDLQPETD